MIQNLGNMILFYIGKLFFITHNIIFHYTQYYFSLHTILFTNVVAHFQYLKKYTFLKKIEIKFLPKIDDILLNINKFKILR